MENAQIEPYLWGLSSGGSRISQREALTLERDAKTYYHHYTSVYVVGTNKVIVVTKLPNSSALGM